MTEEQRVLSDGAFANKFNHTLHAYIDIAGDLVSGALLSQIVYWFSPASDGSEKLRVMLKGKYWLVKNREAWHKEIRISPKQYDRAIKNLQRLNLVVVELHKYNNVPTHFIRLKYKSLDKALALWREEQVANAEPAPISTKGKNQNSPKVKMDFDQRAKSTYTEITTENTTETTKASLYTRMSSTYKASSHDDAIVEKQIKKYCGKHCVPYSQDAADVINLFLRMYEERYGEPHRIPQSKIGGVYDAIARGFDAFGGEVWDVDLDVYEAMISAYFDDDSYMKSRGKKCDHKIYHFVSDDSIRGHLYDRIR